MSNKFYTDEEAQELQKLDVFTYLYNYEPSELVKSGTKASICSFLLEERRAIARERSRKLAEKRKQRAENDPEYAKYLEERNTEYNRRHTARRKDSAYRIHLSFTFVTYASIIFRFSFSSPIA